MFFRKETGENPPLEAVYLDRSGTPNMRHWTAHHLLAPDMRLC